MASSAPVHDGAVAATDEAAIEQAHDEEEEVASRENMEAALRLRAHVSVDDDVNVDEVLHQVAAQVPTPR